MSVVPKRDPRDRTEPQILQGETPNPIDIPAGCRFHPRCPVAEDRCTVTDPQLHQVGNAVRRAAPRRLHPGLIHRGSVPERRVPATLTSRPAETT